MTPFKRGARIVDREKFDAAMQAFNAEHERDERRQFVVVAVLVAAIIVVAAPVAIFAA